MSQNNNSRTKYAVKNAGITAIMQIAKLVLDFVARTIFIFLLNADYLGVNSLFTNVLTVLSFAELGIGTAIVYQLYKPIAENNKQKINSLMNFYQKAYIGIGITIFILGLSLIPFMNFIVKEPPNISENLIFIYVLFLFNTAISYLFSYKKSIITANQKDYIVQIYTRIFQIVQVVLQSIFLLLTHNYIVYLFIMIACTILTNLALCIKANKMYPFLKQKDKNNKLSTKEKRTIFNDVKALFLYKFGSIVLNGTDNIIISILHGVTAVGVAANYTLITLGANSIISTALGSITASIGNLTVKASKKQIHDVLGQLLLISVWLYGILCIGFMCLANDFIFLWIGPNYLLDNFTVFAIVFSTYICGVQFPAYTFRITQGLFVQSRWVPIIAAIINIILSVILGMSFGVPGVFIATGISRLVTTTVVDPWYVYKKNFRKKPINYYIKYLLMIVAVVINGCFQLCIVSLIQIDGISGFVIKVVVLLFTINVIFFIEFFWTKDFKKLIKRFILKDNNVS